MMLAEREETQRRRPPRAAVAQPHTAEHRRRERAASAPVYTARAVRPHERAALDAAFRLRHAVFARELGWVPALPGGHERDRSDAAAHHFAVFARHPDDSLRRPLVAYARVVLPGHGLMLEREFAALLAGRPLAVDVAHAFEVSRFVVHPDYRGWLGSDGRGPVEHLGRAIAQRALAAGRDEWLSVCELRHVRALRLRGLPFARFGRVVEYQPGVPVCAARLDLRLAATRLRERRPGDYAWYLREDVAL
ncbi:MAG TPA: GNAT family N-acyltransferase [Ktedonobacterales bacterium]